MPGNTGIQSSKKTEAELQRHRACVKMTGKRRLRSLVWKETEAYEALSRDSNVHEKLVQGISGEPGKTAGHHGPVPESDESG